MQYHGVAMMTKSAFPIDKTNAKPKMRNGIRCDRSPVVLFLVAVIVYQIYMNYRQEQNWQEAKDEMKSVMLDTSYSLQRLDDALKKLTAKGAVNGLEETTEKLTIYAITPTFARPVQKAELTRLMQTFLHVPNFHWILVEDSAKKTPLVSNLLRESGLTYTHLNVLTPPNYKLGRNDPNWKKPRGVEQRNAALRWLRENLSENDNGVVFFADDDNTYSVQLFREMLKIKTVGVWPVGLVGGLMVEKPICDKVTKKVVGFNAVWKPDRPFPLDMAAFAINLKLILEKKDAWFSFEVQSGYQESEILKQMVTRDQLEPLADLCTKVYVWHTRTEYPVLNKEQVLITRGKPSNLGIEV